MKTTRMIREGLVVVLLASLAGCTRGAIGTTPGGAGSGAGTGPGTGNAGSAGSVPGAPVGGGLTCVRGIPGTSQVPRMTTRQYDAVVFDLLGVTTLAGAGNAAPSSLLAPDSAGGLTDIAWNGYLTAADRIAAEVMAGPNKSRFMACDPAVGTCLADTIRAFGRKAFRRPLTGAEVTSFQRLDNLTPKGTPAEVAEAILYAFLASPSFIMLPELGQEPEAGAIKLTSHEVAARLSFLLWGSVPDDALNAAADAGGLASKEQILVEAQRMVQNRPKTAPTLRALHLAYASIAPGAPHWGQVDHDATKYPNYSKNAVAPMMAELDAFFEEVAFKGGAFKDLFLSNVAFVSSATAPLYGLDAAAFGAQPTRTELNATERPGFLTRVGFLSSFSSFGATSPILRGAFISGRVLGIHPGDPDPAAFRMQPPPGNYTTERQRVEALTGKAPCSGCHGAFINPPGFVLERFNAVGSLQAKDPLGGDIDGTAEVLLGSGKKTITSPVELMTELAKDPSARRHYAEQVVTFATGRQPNQNDACLVEQLNGKVSQESYPILNLLADVTQADSFRLRALGN